MSWIRGTASNHIDLSNQVVAAATGRSLQSVDSVAAAGSGYSVGDIITLTGGTFTIAAQLEVLTLSGSGVATVRIYNAGVYTVDPSDPVAQGSVSPLGGSSATFNCTFAANGWTAELNATYSGSERNVILNGSGGGTDEIYVGWRTFSSVPGDYYNWCLHGFTGFNGALAFMDQPGISPGDETSGTPSLYAGAYLIGSNASFTYTLNITSYRMILTTLVGTNAYPHYLGFGNRFATATEYPYPMIVAGSGAEPTNKATTSATFSTLTDPWTSSSASSAGPMFVYGADGTWHTIVNRRGNSPVSTKCVCPAQRPSGLTSALPQNKFCGSNMAFTDLFWALLAGATGTPNANLLPTPGSNYRVMLPAIVVLSDPSPQVLVEIDDVYWIHTFGGVVSGDRIIDGTGQTFRVYKNCNRIDNFAHLAIREA